MEEGDVRLQRGEHPSEVLGPTLADVHHGAQHVGRRVELERCMKQGAQTARQIGIRPVFRPLHKTTCRTNTVLRPWKRGGLCRLCCSRAID